MVHTVRVLRLGQPRLQAVTQYQNQKLSYFCHTPIVTPGVTVTLLGTEGTLALRYMIFKEDFHVHTFESLSGWCCCKGLLEVLVRNHACCCIGYCCRLLW
jgi:hypothetical protein